MLKKISINIISNWLIQLISYAVPLLMLPYLVRIIGIDNYGKLNFTQSIIQFFIIFVNFGFDLSATNKVANAKEKVIELENIFWQTLYSKLLLLFIGAIIFLLVTVFLNNKVDNKTLFSTFTVVIGFSLTTNWFFQGLEYFKFILLINFISKILLGLFVLFLIKSPNDFWYFNFGLGITQIITAIIMLWKIHNLYNFKFKFYKLDIILNYIKSNANVFFGSFLIGLYVNTNIIILGYFISFKELGYYLVAYKLINILYSTIIIPISQAIFPTISKLLKENTLKTLNIIQRLVIPSLFYIISLGCIIIFINSALIVRIIFGNSAIIGSTLLRIMIFSLYGLSFYNIVFSQIMISLKLSNEYFKVLGYTAIISVFITTILSFHFGSYGAAIGWVITDATLAGLSLFTLKKNNIKIIDLYYFHLKRLIPAIINIVK